MKLLVCGSRDWTDYGRVFAEINREAPTEIVHGAARGADALADDAARDLGIHRVPFPADWAAHGRAAGPIRNRRMLAQARPDRGLAFGALWWLWTKQDGALGVVAAQWKRTGTGDMVQRMLDARVPVRWIPEPGGASVDLAEMPKAPP
ncbi:MAG TPA: SLOG family protein [Anaeromyxobacteraceae bacterium]|nr:SLOG family protein [Anaeromyxobacteraceae bacterium]